MLKKRLLTDRTGNLQEQIMEDAARRMAEDIDFGIMSDLMVETGWVKVTLSPMTSETSNEIDAWITNNVKDKHMTRGLVWVFENEKDANWFKLKWL